MQQRKKRVLLYVGNGIDFNIFQSVPYAELYDRYKVYGGNVGNKLYCMAIEKYLRDENIEYDYLRYDEKNNKCFLDGTISLDEVNNNYDMVVMPQANAFGTDDYYVKRLEMWAEGISKIKIPVYVIGIGGQAKNFEGLKELSDAIKLPAQKFINAVYATGGEFSLRGHFTKELFDSWGANTAVVTGCPSMYQNGRQLVISNDKVPEADFKPAINGTIRDLKTKEFQKIFRDYSESVYFDQEEYIRILYDKNYPSEFDINIKNAIQLVRIYSYTAFKLIFEDRLKLYYDIYPRMKYCVDNNCSFSFGTRIHGNIMSMLWGIPALVYAKDSRTRELAEYFNIPVIQSYGKNKSLYDIYCETDYTKFNKEFSTKFDDFEAFMQKCGIVNSIRKDKSVSEWENEIWNKPEIINKEYLNELEKFFEKNRIILQALNSFITLKH